MFERELAYFNSSLSMLEEELKNKGNNAALDTFTSLFENVNKIHKIEKDYMYVVVSDPLTKFKIEKFYSIRLNELIKEVSNNTLGIKFITEEDATNDPVNINPAIAKETINPEKTKRLLRSEFTFENFVVGESNRFAYSEARQVANSSYAVFNPLYIMGSVGLGKTHLMMAIGHYVLDNNINANVIYTSATQFADDYFRATSTKNPQDIINFLNNYQEADLLLVDDIQFLENKDKTQEVFFKCFDYLHEHNKQIVVTSDRVASELKIMARLKSRFTWGEVVEVSSPDLKLRVSILKRKLMFLISNPKDVPDEVLEQIATLFKANVRELEGALRTYVNYCVSFGYAFTLDKIKEALGSSIPKDEISYKSSDINKLNEVLCDYFRISTIDLTSNSRKSNLVYARNLAFYILRNDLSLQLKEIGKIFGDRDHTTIAHGCDKIKEQLLVDKATVSDLNYIRKKLKE